MQGGDVVQSVLAPAGRQASSIHNLWLLMLWVAVAVFVITLAFVFAALVRGMRHVRSDADPAGSPRALTRSVAAAVALTIVILLALLVASVSTGRTVASLHATSAVTISVVGHQWWWEIEYEDANPSRRMLTANELHIPVSRPIALKVTSRDVIHSFWAPNLQMKRDLIPGYTTAIWMQADRAGVYHGQCAEFCGKQHAHMAFDVIAEPEAGFDTWLNAHRENAREPQSAEEQHGRDVFMAARCSGCHTVRGTSAAGLVGPDLTHFAGRLELAAGTRDNSERHLSDWIADPHSVKPGNLMPPNAFSSEDLHAVTAYMASLR